MYKDFEMCLSGCSQSLAEEKMYICLREKKRKRLQRLAVCMNLYKKHWELLSIYA